MMVSLSLYGSMDSFMVCFKLHLAIKLFRDTELKLLPDLTSMGMIFNLYQEVTCYAKDWRKSGKNHVFAGDFVIFPRFRHFDWSDSTKTWKNGEIFW